MRRNALCLASVLLLCTTLTAQNYRIPWLSFNSGGSPGASASHAMNGSLAQPVQGVATGTDLVGYWGFWYGLGPGGVPPTLDIAVVRIDAPSGYVPANTTVIPRATVKNEGDLPTGFTTWFFLENPSGVRVHGPSQTVTSLGPGEDVTLTFEGYDVAELLGGWKTRCSTYTVGDARPQNDVKDGTFTVNFGPDWPYGWREVKPMPVTPSNRMVKDGGWLAVGPDREPGLGIRGSESGHPTTLSPDHLVTSVVYAAKGNKTGDFYRYDPLLNTWTDCETIPSGEEGKRKPVSKGSAGVTDGERHLYATKGNNTLGFWRYDIAQDTWEALAPVLPGAGKKVKGGTDAVFAPGEGTGCVYLLKGIGTEFYRYNPNAKGWTRLDDVPYGGGRAKYNKGSFLAFDGERYIYAHQASYNNGQNHYMFRFDVVADSWEKATLKGMPVYGTEGGRTKKKKSKDGAAGGWYDGRMYALKGGNTQGFFRYEPDRDTWSESWRAGLEPDTLPMFGTTNKKKRVKNGGDLVYFDYGAFFAVKGNKTLETWRYRQPPSGAQAQAQAQSREGVQAGLVESRERRMGIEPNPLTSGFATLRLGHDPKSRGGFGSCPARVRVFDAAGRCVLSHSLVIGDWSLATPLDLRRLSGGVYLVKIEADGFTGAQKLVVQR